MHLTTPTGTLPQTKKTKLVVLAAFDKGEDGELLPAFEPREMPSEERAVREAKAMATHPAVVEYHGRARPIRSWVSTASRCFCSSSAMCRRWTSWGGGRG